MSSENERSLREELEEASKEVFERTRDEAGRFAKAEEVPPEPEGVQVDDAQVIGEPEPAKVEPVKDEDPFPQSWKQDYKKHWSTLPKEVKDYIRQHEADTRKAMTAQDEDRLLGKNYRGVHQALQPYMPMIQAEGGTAETAINALLNQAYVLRHGSPEQKKQLILSAIKTYGIDITEPTSSQGWVDPQVAELQKQLSELRDWRQQYEQSVQMNEKASIEGQIAAFGADPKHVHFGNPKVQALMGTLLANNSASSMEDAYEQAIWAVPELRSTLQAEQLAQAEAKRVEDAKAKANAARRASGSVRGTSSGVQLPAQSKGSLRDDLKAAFASLKDH